MEQEVKRKLNGWDLDQFQSTVETVKQQPEAGKLIFRTRAKWDESFGVDGRTDGIEQLGQTIRRKFTLRGDHPPQLLGDNTGPTAVETLLAALGSCVAGTYAAQATARVIDLNGFLQLAPVRAGLSHAKVNMRVKSDADEAVLRELCQVNTKASPVFDSVSNPVSIEPSVEKAR